MSDTEIARRTDWSRNRKTLIESSNTNAACMQDIEQALFAMILVDKSSGAPKVYLHVFPTSCHPDMLCNEINEQAGPLRHDPHQEQSDFVHLRYDSCDLARRLLQQSHVATLQNNKTLIRESFCGDGTRIWFDKCFSILIFNDARAAWHYEHTFADAPVPSLGCEHAMVS